MRYRKGRGSFRRRGGRGGRYKKLRRGRGRSSVLMSRGGIRM